MTVWTVEVSDAVRDIVNDVASVEGKCASTDDEYCSNGAKAAGADEYVRRYIWCGDKHAIATADSILACDGIGFVWSSDTAEGCLK